jgi:hypothetical protein
MLPVVSFLTTPNSKEFIGLIPWQELPVQGAEAFRKYGELKFANIHRNTEEIRFPRLNNVVRVVLLHSSRSIPTELKVSQSPTEWKISIPIVDRVDISAGGFSVQMLVDGMPRLAKTPAVSRPGPDGVITLSARDAIVHGEKLQFEPLTHKNTVGYWVNPSDFAEWSYELDQPGEFEVEILQGCGGHAGSDVELGFKEGVVPFVVEETGHFQNFVWRKIGKIALREPGVQVMSLKCRKLAKGAVMDMRQVRLVPVTRNANSACNMHDVEPDLVPPLASFLVTPEPGKRILKLSFFQSLPSATLYLPTNWSKDRKWPVLVELTGNGGYRNDLGDTCSGSATEAQLAYGLSGGYDAICLSVPFLNNSGDNQVGLWWGDPPTYDPAETVRIINREVAEACEKYHGDPDRVILVGFSRGSIAVNAIGLSTAHAARLWKASVCFSHYDGVRQWPFADSDAASALVRLQRLGNRPQFIISESAANGPSQIVETRAFLEKTGVKGNWTFAETGFINHDDRWALRPSPARQQIREWLKTQMQ